MISRRNIRVKVMQVLYALEAHKTPNTEGALPAFEYSELDDIIYNGRGLLKNKFEKSEEMLVLTMLFIAKIALYAERDAHQRASKYLPTKEDLNVNTKIAGNRFIWRLMEDAHFKASIEKFKLDRRIESQEIKKYYQRLTKTEEYVNYASEDKRDNYEEKKIMHFVWRQMVMNNIDYDEWMSDEYSNWEDDKDLIVMLIENYFNDSSKVNFAQFISDEKTNYAFSLLKTTIEKDLYNIQLIQPKLKNWEADRVAQIDLILIKMGINELLFFPTIPEKVTINEYIEIAKQYSTPQSGQFVNGVLDNILKDLWNEGKIEKKPRMRKH